MAIHGSDERAIESSQLIASRLCIKGIPKYLNETRLKEHFGSKGEVTDVKILRTKDGTSRQMAFVGYRSEEEAAAALKYFNKSYLDTCRLAVEYARKYKDSALPRPWSKYSTGSSKHDHAAQQEAAEAAAAAAAADPKAARAAAKAAKKAAKAAAAGGVGSDDMDPKLAEFLELMKPRARASVWSNDDALLAAAAAAGGKEALTAQKQLLKGSQPHAEAAAAAGKGNGRDVHMQDAVFEGDSDSDGGLDDDRDVFELQEQGRSMKQRGTGAAGAGSSSSDEEGPASSDDEEGAAAAAAAAAAGKDSVVVDEGVSDLDYLRARMKPAAMLDDDDMEEQQKQAGSPEEGSSSDMDADEAPASSSGATTSEEGEDDPAAAAAADDDDSDDDSQGEDEAGEEQRYDAGARGDQAGVGPSGHHHTAAAAAGGQEQDGEGGPGGEALVLATGRLFVRNLAYSVAEADLSAAFGAFGDLEEVHLVLDRDTKKSKGTGYVQFRVPEDALKALRALDMTPLQGRLLHVLPSQPSRAAAAEAARKQQEAGPGQGGGYKSQREQQRKADAGNRAAWNSLFMRPDTVAEAVAAHYGISKAQLMDAEAADLPVRMALGEAQVINTTKEALAEAGINVASLEAAAAAAGRGAAGKGVPRSSTTLLVKNLPYSAEEGELGELFGRSGAVVRLVLPATKVVALVEYGEAQDARSAFRGLAYKKYQHVPLYLEWAPKDIWEGDPAAAAAAAAKRKAAASQLPQAPAAAAGGGGAAGAAGAAAGAGVDAEDGEQGGEEQLNSCIYVKNLNFQTTDAAFKKHFDKAVSTAGGTIHAAKVARKPGPDGKLLSMGYGFVECDSEAAAKAAIKQLQGSMLDKHKLQLQLAKRRAAAASSSDKKKKGDKGGGTKLVVRNVAFEATRKDLVGLFGPFGHLKSCRLPKKFDGSHRGFAFVEFVTKQEAVNAMEGVGGIHLYGRRLVVEYAEAAEEEGLTQLRAKTAARMRVDQEEGDEGMGQALKRMKKTL